eukprot:IDg13817t1
MPFTGNTGKVDLIAHHPKPGNSKRSLKVHISKSILRKLCDQGYGIAIAREVNCKYSVIWLAYQQLQETISFEWESLYELYAQGSFKYGTQICSCTTEEHVYHGQTVEIDHDLCVVPSKQQPVHGQPIKVISKTDKDLYACLNGKIGNKFLPFYASHTLLVKGSHTSISTTDKVVVWIGKHLKSRTIIDAIYGPKCYVNLGIDHHQTIIFNDEYVWTKYPTPCTLYALCPTGSSQISISGHLKFVIYLCGAEIVKGVRVDLAKYLWHALFEYGTCPVECDYTDKNEIHVYFSLTQAISFVHNAVIPDYHANILAALA